jgi:hypothetical protein
MIAHLEREIEQTKRQHKAKERELNAMKERATARRLKAQIKFQERLETATGRMSEAEREEREKKERLKVKAEEKAQEVLSTSPCPHCN